MSLQDEIKSARQQIVKDGFDMSIGELIRIYEKGELIINPAYQRVFRWDESRKTRFIESLILGIPIPPLFVYTDEGGRWELIDGLQRLSTILEFAGALKDPEGKKVTPFTPSGTKLLPSLNQVIWESENENTEENALPMAVRLDVERVRIRVEILKRESDIRAKYELFQRLNSGGAQLSPQEARNCVATMLNSELFSALQKLADTADFKNTADLTTRAIEEQKHTELVLRFISYRYKEYNPSIDVHDWLDEALIDISQDKNFDLKGESEIFMRTFRLLNEAAGSNAFKRYANNSFSGAFSIASFETVSHGISNNIDAAEQAGPEAVKTSIINMWGQEQFSEGTKAGTRGSTRLGKLLPLASQWFHF